MILLVGGVKGGSGKTTIATNLAIMRALEGRDILLVDADDQETSSDFTILRNEKSNGKAGYTSIKLTGGAVRTELKRLMGKYDDIVIDTGGRDTTSQRAAMSVADVLLVPFIPRSFDIWTIDKITEIIEEMKTANPSLKACTFLNKTDSRGADNDEAAEMLKENKTLSFIDAPIGTRKAFGNAASQGMSVTELKPKDPKAEKEMSILYRYVFDA